MALERRSSSNTVFLQAKHYCLWQEIKKPVEGSETIEVTNPKTKETIKKHGFPYKTVTGRVVKIAKYDTERKYATRFFGFKLSIQDGTDSYVLDMPYQSQILRRFLRVAPNIKWDMPLSISAFKGKRQDGEAELGIWFRQNDATVPVYFSKENPRGMPAATKDSVTGEWDFKPQHRWLVHYLMDHIIPDVEEAAKRMAPPDDLDMGSEEPPVDDFDPGPREQYQATDEDVPW